MDEMHEALTGDLGVLDGARPTDRADSAQSARWREARFVTGGRNLRASERGDYSTLAPYQQSRGDYGGLELPKILDAVTKEHWFPRTPTETVRSLQLAFKHAVAGRPGPTAVILDGDAVTEPFPDESVPAVWDGNADQNVDAPAREDVATAITASSEADRPVIIAGNGVHAADAYDQLKLSRRRLMPSSRPPISASRRSPRRTASPAASSARSVTRARTDSSARPTRSSSSAVA